MMNRRTFVSLSAAALLGAPLAACTTNDGFGSSDPQARRTEIDSGVDAALDKLYRSVQGARELGAKARGLLVFPNVLSAGLFVGGEYGEGAMRTDGATRGYFSTASGSLGLQAGAQSKAVVFMFMTQDALDGFLKSTGWTAGVDATVALAKIGANGSLDTNTVRAPVVGFVIANAGLMAGVSLEGTKVSRLPL